MQTQGGISVDTSRPRSGIKLNEQLRSMEPKQMGERHLYADQIFMNTNQKECLYLENSHTNSGRVRSCISYGDTPEVIAQRLRLDSLPKPRSNGPGTEHETQLTIRTDVQPKLKLKLKLIYQFHRQGVI